MERMEQTWDVGQLLRNVGERGRALARVGSPHLGEISCSCKGYHQCDELLNLVQSSWVSVFVEVLHYVCHVTLLLL
jgi:hypothetical protein